MAVSRLNGRTGHSALAQRVQALETALGPARAQKTALVAAERVWQAFPPELRQYLVEANRRAAHDPERWPAVRLLWRVAADRVRRGEDPLVPVAGWLLRQAWWQLAVWHGHDRARSAQHSHETAELAAQELYGVDEGVLLRLWTRDRDGVEWLRLWRSSSRDEGVLERAGLSVGTAERELLDQLG